MVGDRNDECGGTLPPPRPPDERPGTEAPPTAEGPLDLGDEPDDASAAAPDPDLLMPRQALSNLRRALRNAPVEPLTEAQREALLAATFERGPT